MKKEYGELFQIVKGYLSCGAHHLDHVTRVFRTSEKIAKYYPQVDENVLFPAVILHDIARVKESEDTTGKTDHALLGAEIAKGILIERGYSQEKIEKICHCICAHRFRTGICASSLEAKILHDADKLDVLGAIGIARVFMISGKYDQRLARVEEKQDNCAENGRIKNLSEHNPLIEYHNKMVHIPEKLYLEESKKIAEKEFAFTKSFFEKLELELEESEIGKDSI